MITVINIPDDARLISAAAEKAVKDARRVFVQSERISSFERFRELNSNLESLDPLFEGTGDFDILATDIAEHITAAGDDAVFLTMGGIVSNRIVEKLMRAGNAVILPSPDNGDACIAFAMSKFAAGPVLRLTVFDLDVVSLSGHEAVLVTGISGRYEMSKVKLFLSQLSDDTEVALYSGGNGKFLAVKDLDREDAEGSEACVYMPAVPYTGREFNTFSDLVEIMDRLRAKDGCPWDIKQTHESIASNCIEEAYEVADAIGRGATDELYDELGDLLLQVVFHAKIAKDCGEFDMTDVTTAICKKLIRRHPHIFGDITADTAEEVLRNWDDIKRQEKDQDSIADSIMDVPAGMSTLLRTQKIQKKAANVGFDFRCADDALEKLKEEIEEFRCADDDHREDEAGDMLFALCNYIRLSGLSCETALMRANEKFIKRFEFIEKNAESDVRSLSLEEMDELWEKSKKSLK